jgi:hypothetical protein
MSTVLEQIEQQIAKLSTKAVKKNTGTIRTVADGVAKIEGLSEVMYNEMVQFPGGAIGIALNLEEDEVGCVILGDISKLKESRPPAASCPCRSASPSSAVRSTRLAIPSTAKARSQRRNSTPSKKSRLASLFGNPFPSRSSPASWRSTP